MWVDFSYNTVRERGYAMTQILSGVYLDYSDILIRPKMGINLNSRRDVNLQRVFKFKHGQTRTGLGVFNANMATVGNTDVPRICWHAECLQRCINIIQQMK